MSPETRIQSKIGGVFDLKKINKNPFKKVNLKDSPIGFIDAGIVYLLCFSCPMINSKKENISIPLNNKMKTGNKIRYYEKETMYATQTGNVE